MPLTTRAVSPTNLSVHRLSASVRRDELQCVANGTLANLIRQLSSLSKNAEQLFSEIHRETLKIDHKTNTLFLRVEKLAQKITQNEMKPDTGGLEENHMRKAFKSCNIIDQQSLHPQTLPNSLCEIYQKCDPPPQLDLLNPYREDPKPALRYYTDPNYFFELWKKEILKECRAQRTTRSPIGGANKSPNRRRKQREMGHNGDLQIGNAKVHILNDPHARQAANVLMSHYSATGNQMMAGRTAANHQQHYMGQQKTEAFMHFPAEYQAPQNALSGTNRMPVPPPGMSLHPNANISMQEQTYNVRAYQPPVSLYTHQDVAQPRPEQNMSQAHFQQANSTAGQHFGGGQSTQVVDSLGLEKRMAQVALDNSNKSQPMANLPNLAGFLEDDDDELPPPPPPVLSGQAGLSLIAGGNASQAVSPSSADVMPNSAQQNHQTTLPMQFLPSGTGEPKAQQTAPVPPPPPPPPMQPIGSFGTPREQPEANNEEQSPIPPIDADPEELKKPAAPEAVALNNAEGGSQMSSLLMEIQSGIKLKKVARQAELAEARAAAEANDVAAILKRRMEHVLGNDTDSSGNSNEGDDGEWDD